MNWSIVSSVLFYLLYWPLISHLLDAVLEKPKLKRAHWFFCGVCNVCLVFGAYARFGNALFSYFIMIALILIELLLFYRERFSCVLLCTLACAIHVLAAFMIIVSGIAVLTAHAPYVVLTTGSLFTSSAIASFAVLDLVIWGAIRFVPLSQVKLINQHREQQWFIIAWMLINNAFLLYAVHAFHQPGYPAQLSGNQTAAALTAMISLYIVLFFSIKTSSILGYKEKSEELEQAILLEQQFRNSIVKDALASYEVNVTQDRIKGFESWRDEMGDVVDCYSDMLVFMSRKLIYSEDIEEFTQKYTRSNILHMFEKGQSEFTAEYRRLIKNEKYVWVRAVINVVKDLESDDITAFMCVKDIDEEKKTQLELQRLAECDALTGLYNKSAASKLIDEHLFFSKNRKGSAFFMIDVDNFKEINDHLGHVFGDAVLCELGEKLLNIFRSSDIVGRIGGDEFIVFMKDGAVGQKAEEKAEEIRQAFLLSYQGPRGEECSISSSIGIAFSPKDGHCFLDLYSHADTALYEAKSKGKNSYRIFDGLSFQGYSSQRTEIHSIGNILQKGFRQNRIEYTFKMLYQSKNPVAAIHSVLELVANHFSFERGYIFETSKDGKTTSNTFEWCAEGVTPEIDNLQNLPVASVASAYSSFYEHGIFILKSLDDIPPMERAVLEPQGIQSMFQFGIFDKDWLLGFIGFDNCRSDSVLKDSDIDEIATICNLLATFFVKHHIDEAAANDLLVHQELMNLIDSYIYVIRPESFEILFMNDKIQQLKKGAPASSACHSFFRGREKPCEDCPIRKRSKNDGDRFIQEIYNDKLGIWMEVTASTLRWTDGSLVYLIHCSDITKQKELRLQHIRELENIAYVDELTGCRSYHKFKKDAQRILEEQSGLSHFLVKLDVDNFRLINQIYGYEKGNEVLRCVARAIQKTTRNEDEIFSRVANDEFIALFTIEKKEEINVLNRAFVQNFYACMGGRFVFQCRFPHGRYLISPGDAKKMDINSMFEKVNIAHKAAKLDKAVSFVFYDESMTKEDLRVKEIENKMTAALLSDEFNVYLQPKYSLDKGTIGGAEALTRWKNKNSDLFLPSSFIPVFERNGFITKLDFHIFRKVCQIIKEWIEAGIAPVVVSVNFSRLHLGNANFVKELCEIADSFGIHRNFIEIEITETVIYDNIDTLEVLLEEIHRGGFSMSMDDFGSGYSSLGMLKNLPVDVIKMDRSFFANQRDAARSKTVVGSVIRMASELGIRTVAEGVEEQEHIDLLRELHCDMVQGYYFSKPLALGAFNTLLKEQKGTKH